jgi:hypothetical protein
MNTTNINQPKVREDGVPTMWADALASSTRGLWWMFVGSMRRRHRGDLTTVRMNRDGENRVFDVTCESVVEKIVPTPKLSPTSTLATADVHYLLTTLRHLTRSVQALLNSDGEAVVCLGGGDRDGVLLSASWDADSSSKPLLFTLATSHLLKHRQWVVLEC